MNHWIPTAHRPMAGRIEDHVLLLQLERANEALSDRIDELEEADDGDPISGIQVGLADVLVDMREMSDLIVKLTERVIELEREVASLGTNQDTLLDALRRAVLQ